RARLPNAAKQVGECCARGAVPRLAVGEVRDMQPGGRLGTAVNQQRSQWPHGQFTRSRRETAARLGREVAWLDEAEASGTTTCWAAGQAPPCSPCGRRSRGLGCGEQGGTQP